MNTTQNRIAQAVLLGEVTLGSWDLNAEGENSLTFTNTDGDTLTFTNIRGGSAPRVSVTVTLNSGYTADGDLNSTAALKLIPFISYLLATARQVRNADQEMTLLDGNCGYEVEHTSSRAWKLTDTQSKTTVTVVIDDRVGLIERIIADDDIDLYPFECTLASTVIGGRVATSLIGRYLDSLAGVTGTLLQRGDYADVHCTHSSVLYMGVSRGGRLLRIRDDVRDVKVTGVSTQWRDLITAFDILWHAAPVDAA